MRFFDVIISQVPYYLKPFSQSNVAWISKQISCAYSLINDYPISPGNANKKDLIIINYWYIG